VHAPEGTAVPRMIRAAGLRWKIEQDDQAGEDQFGLGRHQVRGYTPWRRHVTWPCSPPRSSPSPVPGWEKDPEAEQSRSRD